MNGSQIIAELQEQQALAREAFATLARSAGTTAPELEHLFRKARVHLPARLEDISRVNPDGLIARLERKPAENLERETQEADRISRRTTHIRQLGLSTATANEMFSWIGNETLKKFAREFDPCSDGGALILGQTGIGKSVACFLVMNRTITKQRLEVYETGCGTVKSWASFDALDVGLAQQKISFGQEDTQEFVAAKEAEILILDDLGWERRHHVDTLIELAAHRYKQGRPTLVTSGKTLAELSDTYGDALLRRFVNVDGKAGAILDIWSEK